MHCLFTTGVIGFASLVICAAAHAQEPKPAADTCIIELNTTADAMVTIDGREYGKKRQFTFRGLTPGHQYTSEVAVRFAASTTERRTIFVKGGHRIRLAVQSKPASQLELVLQSGHSDKISCVAFSPDGRFVLTGSDDQTAIVWARDGGEKLRTFRGHSGKVTSVAFSPDGRKVLIGTGEDTAVLWETASGKRLRTFEGHSVAFSPDGRQVLTGTWDDSAILWETATGKKMRTFPGESFTSIAFSADGRQVLTGGIYSKMAILWDVRSGKQLRSFDVNATHVHSVDLARDGQQVLTGSSDGTAILWEASTGTKLQTFEGHSSDVSAVAFSPDGRQILTGSTDYSAILWEASTGAKLQTFEGHSSDVSAVAFSPDGRQVLTGSDDQTAIVWETASGQQIRTLRGHSGSVRSAAISPDGWQVLTGLSDETAVLWEAVTGRKLRTFKGNDSWVNSVTFSPDGTQVLTGSLAAILWDTATGKRLHRFGSDISMVNSVAFSPDGRQILTGTWDNRAILWDTATGKKLRKFKGHSMWVQAVAFSPDGTQVLTGSFDNTAILWEASTGRKLRTLEGHSQFVQSVAFSPDGRQVLTGSNDHVAILWEASTGAKLRTFEGHSSNVKSVAFGHDGRQVLTGSSHGTVILWEASTGKQLRKFHGHSYSVESVAFSKDDRRVLTGSLDGSVRLWDVATGDELVRLINLGDDWLAMTAEGLFDGPEGGRKKVFYRVGDGLNVVPVDRFFQDFYYPGLLAAIWRGERPLPVVRLGEALPPKVRIITPDRGGSVDKNTVTIEVEIADQGGGVKGPWVMHNNARVIVSDGQSQRSARGVRKQFSLPLVQGENTIAIHAASADGSWESEPAVLQLQYDEPLEKPSLYVLAIGIDQYADANMALDYAVADAQSVAAIFQDRGPALYGNVKVVTAENASASRDGIYNAIKHVATLARPQDTVVLFLAGQGAVVGKQYYFLPYNYEPGDLAIDEAVRAGGMLASDIGQQLTMTPALKRLLLFDTCRAGKQTTFVRTSRNPFALRGAIERLARSEGTFTIAGVATTDKAKEVDDLQHGILTYSLLAGLRGVDSGPLKDQWIDTGLEVREPLAHVLPWFSFASKQTPQLTRRYFGAEQEVQYSVSGTSFPVLPIPYDGASPASATSIASLKPFTPPKVSETVGQGIGTLHVIAVGVNEYQEESLNLKYAAADAESIAELFERRGGRTFAKLKITRLLNAAATRDRIQQTIAKVAEESKADDTFIVFLAGHGAMVGQRYFFLPHEFHRQASQLDDDIRNQGLAADVLADAVSAVPALKRLLILDTCASGGALEINRQGNNALAFRGAIEALGTKQGVFTIAASASSEEAQEIDELGHGVLTYALLAGLRAVQSGPLEGNSVRPANSSGTIDVLDWLSFAAGQVPRLTERYLGRPQDIQTCGQGTSFPILTVDETSPVGDKR